MSTTMAGCHERRGMRGGELSGSTGQVAERAGRLAVGASALAALLGATCALAQADSAPVVRWRAEHSAVATVPPLPPTSTFPVQLVLDDDSFEGTLGVASGQNAKQFLFFERFGPVPGFTLQEVWILFPGDAPVGGAIEIVIYEDTDGDPSNGATLRATFATTVSANDGNTFSVYPLPAPLAFDSGTEVLIGAVPRFIQSGVTPFIFPAAIDGTASQGRSWLAVWLADPPDPPLLPADQITGPLDDFQPGNWMIRGFGTGVSPLEVPALGPAGLAALAALLAAGGLVLLRRRDGARIAMGKHDGGGLE
jgi:hypothetical protein